MAALLKGERLPPVGWTVRSVLKAPKNLYIEINCVAADWRRHAQLAKGPVDDAE